MTQQMARPEKNTGLTVKLVAEMTGFAPAEIALISRTVAIGAPLQELAVFLHSCRQLGLDPLLRQAYWIRRSGKGALQVGIDGFRAIAERSGTYAGAESLEFRGQMEWAYNGATVIVPEIARATIWKIVGGHKSAFVGEAYWSEFVPSERDAFMWAKMPRHMLGKVAEAQALRRAFPAQLGAIEMNDDIGADMQNPPVITEVEPEPDPEPKQKRLAARHKAIYDNAYDLPEPEPEAEVQADE